MSKQLFSLIAGLMLLFSVNVIAADHGTAHAGHETMTWSMVDGHTKMSIVYQAINLTILVAGLLYLVRSKINAHLSQKKDTYHETIKRVERARADAEKRNFELKTRLETLESTSQDALERAKREAEELQAKIVAEAEHASKNIKEEASRVSNTETHRAIQHLREEVVEKALKKSRTVLQDKMLDPDQRRLQKEFVEKIQVVQG